MTPRAAGVSERPPAESAGSEGGPSDDHRPAGAFTDLLKAAIAPVLSAAALVGLLTIWTVTGGAGTLRRVHVDVTLAAIPLSFRPGAGHALADATTYLEIRNLGSGDDLVGATSPIARGALLVRHGRTPLAVGGQLPLIPLPAGSTLDLSPFGADLILIRPRPLHIGQIVPVTLDFKHAGRVRVDLVVTAGLASP